MIDGDEDYKYLVKMPMDSVSQENVGRLEKDHANQEQLLENTKAKTIHQMWLEELDILRQQYLEFKEDWERSRNQSSSKKEGKSGEKKKIKIVKK